MTVRREIATRDRRAALQGREAYLKQYVDQLSGEPARLAAETRAAKLVAAANSRLEQNRS
jgi:hypothetical protein